jgi:uncharacterized membrane protein (UPF0127 family)
LGLGSLGGLGPGLARAAPGEGTPEWAVAVFPSGAEFALEIAASDAERARGYMFREHVGPREGMLFLFPGPGTHSIWMKNCKVSLDLIWLDADFSVVHIVHERPPCPAEGDCPAVAPMRLSRYVLEIAGGIAAEQHLNLGDRLVILSEPAIR